jgi:hypothetical protein
MNPLLFSRPRKNKIFSVKRDLEPQLQVKHLADLKLREDCAQSVIRRKSCSYFSNNRRVLVGLLVFAL